MTQNQQTSTSHRNRFRTALRAFAGLGSSLSLAVLLAGCAGNMPSNFGVPVPAPSGGAHYTGTVFGGQQPVVGATMQIYTVGTGGLKSASTALIAATYTTDANGGFSIPAGAYSCTSATQVYIVASGGNAGSGTNANLNLVAALGSCAALTPSTNIVINELTTVAAAYALAPFAADLTHIGATGSSPTGLVNAFANAAALVNTASGSVGGASLPVGTVVPTSELDTLANILASCVNSNGTCSTLFSATGGTETFSAALGIARNPGATAITGLYSLSSPTAPFQPSMGSQPNDFTVALTLNANGGLATPYGLAVDAQGYVWVTNESGNSVVQLTPAGDAVATTSSPAFFGAQALAVDGSGNIWVAGTATNNLVEIAVTSETIGASIKYTTGLSAPVALAINSANQVYVANFNGGNVAEFSSSGTLLNSNATDLSQPSAVALNSSGNVYVAGGGGTVVSFNGSLASPTVITDNDLQGGNGLAVDLKGNIFLTGFTTGAAVSGALSEFTTGGGTVGVSPVTTGLTSTAGVASDGTSVWVANSTTAGSLVQYAYGSATPASPATGFGSLNTPVGVAIDASGCIWTTNSGSNTISKFIGLAVPVTTPLQATVGPPRT